nr:DUF6320 domain-containing protein [Sedimentibacter sp.]
MKRCEKCKINVIGKRESCPLCQGLLVGQDEEQEEIFPHIFSVYKQHNMFFRILILISIILVTISVAVNIMFPQKGAWSLFIVGGLASVWVSLITAINKRNNIPKNIVYQVMIISIALVVWDFMTHWKGWSIEYVIPILCVFAMISMAIISKVLKLRMEDYILYLIIDGVFGIIPVLFILIGILDVIYPSMICVVTSIISLSTILIFEGESMRAEMKKRLHL